VATDGTVSKAPGLSHITFIISYIIIL